jgi:RNA polymerase sigma factor (sigma-70 family)
MSSPVADVEEMYRRHGAMVLRRARSILGEEQAARDAMQEVFLAAMKAGASFRGEASPVTWLYRMTTNHCLNRIRDQGRRSELLEQHGTDPDDASSPPPPDAGVDVARVLRSVPAELREIAVYHYVDQMNHEEIAALTGVSRRTIGNRLEAFRAAARAALGEETA